MDVAGRSCSKRVPIENLLFEGASGYHQAWQKATLEIMKYYKELI